MNNPEQPINSSPNTLSPETGARVPNTPTPQTGSQIVERPEALHDADKAISPGTSPTTVPLVLVPFPDGTLLRYAPNPCKEGTFVLVDAVGNQVAVVVNQYVADFLARGAGLMLIAMKKAQIDSQKKIITPGA